MKGQNLEPKCQLSDTCGAALMTAWFGFGVMGATLRYNTSCHIYSTISREH